MRKLSSKLMECRWYRCPLVSELMYGRNWKSCQITLNKFIVSVQFKTGKKIHLILLAYGQKTNQLKDMERGPIITDQPRSLAVFGDPPTVFIECKGQANPTPQYTWKRGSGELVTSTISNRYIYYIIIDKA